MAAKIMIIFDPNGVIAMPELPRDSTIQHAEITLDEKWDKFNISATAQELAELLLKRL